MPAKKPFFISTPIYYSNDALHLGHAITTVWADAVARFHRQRGEEVVLSTGLDEHGTKVAQAAEKSGKSPQDFVDGLADRFPNFLKKLGVAPTKFIRTTDPAHKKTAKEFWERLAAAGDLRKEVYEGLYCEGCEGFKTEKDLTADGLCPDHLKKPVPHREENWVFAVSKFAPQIREKIESGEMKVIPDFRKKEALAFLDEARDVSVSRDIRRLRWGIPVPNDPEQVMYVWVEAVMNYITASDGLNPAANVWPNNAWIGGKEILRFHAIMWPAMLLSANLPLPKCFLFHGFITVDGQKMSKSLGNVVDPVALVEKWGTDPVRYFILRDLCGEHDGDFSEEKMRARYEADLQKGLGNLVSRLLTLAEKMGLEKIDLGEFPIFAPGSATHPILDADAEISREMAALRPAAALEKIWEILRGMDGELSEKTPWKMDPPAACAVLGPLLRKLALVAHFLEPFLPETAAAIEDRLGITPRSKATGGAIPGPFKKSEPLFPAVEK